MSLLKEIKSERLLNPKSNCLFHVTLDHSLTSNFCLVLSISAALFLLYMKGGSHNEKCIEKISIITL